MDVSLNLRCISYLSLSVHEERHLVLAQLIDRSIYIALPSDLYTEHTRDRSANRIEFTDRQDRTKAPRFGCSFKDRWTELEPKSCSFIIRVVL